MPLSGTIERIPEGKDKVETYDRTAEIAASELAVKPRTTPQERANFATTVVDSASLTANYIINTLVRSGKT